MYLLHAALTWDLDPIVIPSLGFPRWYSLMWLFGVALGYRIILKIYKSEGLKDDDLQKLAIIIMVFAIIGARLGHVFFYDWAYYSQNLIEILPIKLKPSFRFTGFAGLASHGGVIGALLGLYWYNRKRKLNYGWLLDRLTIGGAVLGGFIRLGNFFNSEIIGKASDLPWAVVFTRVDSVPRHPAQLYEALFYWIIGWVLYSNWKKKGASLKPGYLFGLGITLIFLQRFFVEFIKENQVAFEDAMSLNMGQILSIPIALLGLTVMYWLRGKPTTIEEAPENELFERGE